jgi:hypothetical protein
MNHDLAKVEAQLLKLDKGIKKNVIPDKTLEEILKNIHGPGWTTPAEYAMFLNALKIANTHVEILRNTIDYIVDANRLISHGQL